MGLSSLIYCVVKLSIIQKEVLKMEFWRSAVSQKWLIRIGWRGIIFLAEKSGNRLKTLVIKLLMSMEGDLLKKIGSWLKAILG